MITYRVNILNSLDMAYNIQKLKALTWGNFLLYVPTIIVGISIFNITITIILDYKL